VKATADLDSVGAYKIGAILALSAGLPAVVEMARKYSNKPLIYDHQKAATDIPEMGLPFAETLQRIGISAVILFPLAGPETQNSWIRAAQDAGLRVIVGGLMTHPTFLCSDGGYVRDDAVDKIYGLAAQNRVTDYVVPGNKPDSIRHIRELLTMHGVEPIFFSPGFITQGGRVSEAVCVSGASCHAIVGRAIYNARDMRAAAISLASEL
jgi:orotidine-5'-phosphate decarboxylase